MAKNNKELRLDLNEGQRALVPNNYHQYSREKDLVALKKKSAERLGVSPEALVFFNGTYNALDILFNFMVADGEEIIMPVPTFAFYHKFEKYRKIVFKKIRYGETLALPVTKILKALNKKTKLIYLVNPNNPLGVASSLSELEVVIKAAKLNHVWVIVDEVYAEYWGDSVIPLLKRYKNLIVLRSFSKIGLSGLKLGLTVSDEKMAKKIEEMRGDLYNVTKPAIDLVTKNLAGAKQIEAYVNDIKKAKGKLLSFLQERKVVVLPSETNFVTAKFYNNQDFCLKLRERGILVKDMSHFPDAPHWLKSFMRITVPQTRELPVLIESLRTVMDDNKREI